MNQRLVCARCRGRTDPGLWAEGTVFDRKCNLCAEPVALGKAGQKVLADDPSAEVVCMQCYADEVNESDMVEPAPGALEEAARFFRKKAQ